VLLTLNSIPPRVEQIDIFIYAYQNSVVNGYIANGQALS